MASWKKVIVSGSDAVLNQLTVGTSQVVTSTNQLTTTKLTGSFTGSFFGDGTGITGITATGLNVPGQITEITNQPFVVSGSAALQKITLADITSQITGSGLTKASGTGNTIMLNTSSAHFITGSRTLLSAGGSYLAYNNSTGLFTFDSGSYGTFLAGNGLTAANGVLAVGAGDGIAVTADAVSVDTGSAHFVTGSRKAVFETGRFVDSSYIDFTVTSGVSVTAVLISGSIQNGHLANSAVTIGNASISLGGTATALAGLNYVYATGLSGSFITASSGINSSGYIAAAQDITSSAGNIKASNGYLAIGTPSVVAPAAIAGEIVSPTARFDNLTAGTLATLAAANVTNNLTVGGNLTVNGTASFINSTNVYVKDQFILLNSGSTTIADSGIVAAYSASGVGSAFYLEALPGSYGRWGIAYNVSGTATTVTHDAYMVAVSQSAGAPAPTPTWGGTTYGYGNMHVDSGTGDIYIYS